MDIALAHGLHGQGSVGHGYIKAGKTACFEAVLGFRAGLGGSYVMGICWGLICSFYIVERSR